jgi:hypothetical protein
VVFHSLEPDRACASVLVPSRRATKLTLRLMVAGPVPVLGGVVG